MDWFIAPLFHYFRLTIIERNNVVCNRIMGGSWRQIKHIAKTFLSGSVYFLIFDSNLNLNKKTFRYDVIEIKIVQILDYPKNILRARFHTENCFLKNIFSKNNELIHGCNLIRENMFVVSYLNLHPLWWENPILFVDWWKPAWTLTL